MRSFPSCPAATRPPKRRACSRRNRKRGPQARGSCWTNATKRPSSRLRAALDDRVPIALVDQLLDGVREAPADERLPDHDGRARVLGIGDLFERVAVTNDDDRERLEG